MVGLDRAVALDRVVSLVGTTDLRSAVVDDFLAEEERMNGFVVLIAAWVLVVEVIKTTFKDVDILRVANDLTELGAIAEMDNWLWADDLIDAVGFTERECAVELETFMGCKDWLFSDDFF